MTRLAILGIFMLSTVSAYGEIAGESAEDKRAEDLLKKADLKYDVKEVSEAIEMYRNIIDRFPKSKYRFTSHLRLGKHYFEEKQYNDAIDHLYKCSEGSQDTNEQAESLYLIGVSYFEQGQYQKTFSELRKVTANFPGTEFCNKAYHYLGMAHFRLKHYKRAIEAFRMVGTSIAENDENVKKLSPGKRLFIKVNDRDLTILSRQKKTLMVTAKAKTGDEEEIELHSRGITGTDFIGSVKTELGEPAAKDGVLQVLGTDSVTVTYMDTHASERKRDIPRVHEIVMADDARIDIVDGIFKSRVQGVALERSANFRVIDADRDLGKGQDQVKIVARVKREVKEEEGKIVRVEDLIQKAEEKEKKYEILDEEPLTLMEIQEEPEVVAIKSPEGKKAEEGKDGGAAKDGATKEEGAKKGAAKEGAAKEEPAKEGAAKEEAAKDAAKEATAKETPAEPKPATPIGYHSGIFIGSMPIKAGDPKKGDGVLQADTNDMIEVEYADEISVASEKAEARKDEVVVVKGQVQVPIPYESQIRDSALRVKTELQVSEALMHMGRIYKELGLKEQADDKFVEALKECAKVARERGAYDKELLEKTQFLLWKIYFEKGDHQQAATVCLNLLRNFPHSEFADDALMMMGDVSKEKGEYTSAISYYRRLLQIGEAPAAAKPGEKQVVIGTALAPDAQYAIAECYEKMGGQNKSNYEQALVEYKRCAELFPTTNFAPKAITKIANFYYQMKDYPRALEIYDKTLRDYPDAEFVDLILLNYGKCQVMMKDYAPAAAKFKEVIEDHPDSKYVDKAQKYYKYVMKKLGQGGAVEEEGQKGGKEEEGAGDEGG
jgi:tetratricopeptide (TPR) repeat protein